MYLFSGGRAVIISGSPESVVLSADLSCDGQIFLYNMPILGICYGMQVSMLIGSIH